MHVLQIPLQNLLQNPMHRRRSRAGLIAAVALCCSLPLAAQITTPAPNKAAVEANYQRDRAACQAITTPADRSNCLRDAAAARSQALSSGAPRTVPSPEQLKQNALKRCEEHPTTEGREICERMVRGEGQASGSVRGGGVIRELETTVPAPPPPLGTPGSLPPMQPMPAPADGPAVSPPPPVPAPVPMQPR